MPGASEPTFSRQASLPQLPVPDLSSTLTKYLQSARPHLTDDEYRKTKQIVEEFRANQGAQLQAALLERAANTKNWLSQWWDDEAYMRPRYPIFPYVNFGGPWALPPVGQSVSLRVGILLHFAARYWLALRRQQIPIMYSRSSPWCMQQVRRLFNTCRVPGHTVDHLVEHFRTEDEGACPSHAVLQYRGHYYKVPLLDASGQQPRSIAELTAVAQAVRQRAHNDRSPSLGPLTCNERTQWANDREYFCSLSPLNAELLAAVESSVLLQVLTDELPDSDEALQQFSVFGHPDHMWADKSLVLHNHANGTGSSNCDHSAYEAIVMVLLFDDINTRGAKWLKENPTHVRQAYAGPPVALEELPFVVDAHMRRQIDSARAFTLKNTSDLQLRLLRFEEFGAGLFKQQRLYTDTFIQLALQLAYYRLHNRPASVYETASTRKYWHARTDTVRSCTAESVSWLQAMRNAHSLNDPSLHRLFWAAYAKHNEWMTACMDGRGIDRHLLGLRMMARELGQPEPVLYTDAAYGRSGGDGNYQLSTSLVGYTASYGAVSPMAHDGYGTFYNINPQRITISIVTFKSSAVSDAERMRNEIVNALRDVRLFLEAKAAKL